MKLPREAVPFLTFGWTSSLTLAVTILLGLKMDNALGTGPSLTLVGALIGLFTVGYLFFSFVKKINKK